MKTGRLKGQSAYGAALVLLALALPLSLMGAVCFGTVDLPLGKVYTVIGHEFSHLVFRTPFPPEWAPGTAVHDVVWLIRLPRLVLGAAVGAGLLFWWYRSMTRKQFGGVTGDLLGFFVELSQLTMLFLLALASLFI